MKIFRRGISSVMENMVSWKCRLIVDISIINFESFMQVCYNFWLNLALITIKATSIGHDFHASNFLIPILRCSIFSLFLILYSESQCLRDNKAVAGHVVICVRALITIKIIKRCKDQLFSKSWLGNQGRSRSKIFRRAHCHYVQWRRRIFWILMS